MLLSHFISIAQVTARMCEAEMQQGMGLIHTPKE